MYVCSMQQELVKTMGVYTSQKEPIENPEGKAVWSLNGAMAYRYRTNATN